MPKVGAPASLCLQIVVLATSLAVGACGSTPEAERRYAEGLKLHTSGDWHEAIAEFDQAIELDTSYVEALVARGLVYIELGQMDAAIVSLDRAISYDNKHADAYAWRAYAHYMDRAYGPAHRDAGKAIRLNDQLAIGYALLAANSDAEGRSYTSDMRRSIDLDPAMAHVYVIRGIIRGGNDDPDRAIQDFEMAIELDEDLAWRTSG